jgi:hypothetical protein
MSKKLLLAAVALCLVAGSAWAYGDHDDWDCGGELMVTQWKDKLSIGSPKAIPITTIKQKKGRNLDQGQVGFQPVPASSVAERQGVPLHDRHGLVPEGGVRTILTYKCARI